MRSEQEEGEEAAEEGVDEDEGGREKKDKEEEAQRGRSRVRSVRECLGVREGGRERENNAEL